MGDDTFTVGSGSLGVDDTLWDSFASEVSQFVKEVEVGDDDGALRTSSHGILVVVKGSALGVGDCVLLHLWGSLNYNFFLVNPSNC